MNWWRLIQYVRYGRDAALKFLAAGAGSSPTQRTVVIAMTCDAMPGGADGTDEIGVFLGLNTAYEEGGGCVVLSQ